jgi:hypothetical protein
MLYDPTMPRVIYSLAFDLMHHGQQMLRIAPLLPDGQSPHCRACAPKRRVVDLRSGDQVEHGASRYRIKKVSAYRQAHLRQRTSVIPYGSIGYGYRHRPWHYNVA